MLSLSFTIFRSIFRPIGFFMFVSLEKGESIRLSGDRFPLDFHFDVHFGLFLRRV